MEQHTYLGRSWSSLLALIAVAATLAAVLIAGYSWSAHADETASTQGAGTITGVTLEWSGNTVMQKKAHFGGTNYLSAGALVGVPATEDGDEADGDSETETQETIDGTEAGFQVKDGNVSVVYRDKDGTEVEVNEALLEELGLASNYALAKAFVNQSYTQSVRLTDGSGTINSDGSADISWIGSWSANFYGGLVPFSFTNPHLHVNSDGTAQLIADISGYASSMDNPYDKSWLGTEENVEVATFTNVTIKPEEGTLSITPDYAGVEVEIPATETQQNKEADGWGSWPQTFVDFQLKTGLSSYWYSSGGSVDAQKPGLPVVLDFTSANYQQPTGSSASQSAGADSGAAEAPQAGASGSASSSASSTAESPSVSPVSSAATPAGVAGGTDTTGGSSNGSSGSTSTAATATTSTAATATTSTAATATTSTAATTTTSTAATTTTTAAASSHSSSGTSSGSSGSSTSTKDVSKVDTSAKKDTGSLATTGLRNNVALIAMFALALVAAVLGGGLYLNRRSS